MHVDVHVQYIKIHKSAHNKLIKQREKKPSQTTSRSEHYYIMESQMDVVFQLSGSPSSSHVVHIFPSFFFFLVNCVYCLDIRAQFDSFLNKCLKRCESFNDWIE